jgi:hypothetical protein
MNPQQKAIRTLKLKAVLEVVLLKYKKEEVIALLQRVKQVPVKKKA